MSGPQAVMSRVLFMALMSGTMALVFAGFFGFLEYGFSRRWLETWVQGTLISWPLGA